ncbi:MAG: DUF4328 domain-containing protein [Acidimicrobiia bacterium]|nr:DUF4328 domain-containing protein [Acidimicrobiia bacterium]
MQAGPEDPHPPRPPSEDRPLTVPGQVVRFLLGVAVTCSVVTLAHSLAAWTNSDTYGVVVENPRGAALVGELAETLWTVLYITTGVAFAGWMFRATRNNVALGTPDLVWGPGWSWGGWFIPGANYVLPFLVLREIWRASDPERPADTPLTAMPVWPGLVWFWVFWIGSALAQGVKFAVLVGARMPLDVTAATAPDLPRWLYLADAGSYLLLIPSGFLAMQFTSRVEARQARRRTRASLSAGT